MNSSAPSNSPAPARLPFEPLITAIGDPLRWAILREMADGQPRMITEIAARVGRKDATVQKAVAHLRAAGLVVTHQRLQRIPARFLPTPGERILDTGYFLLRLDTPTAG